MSGVDERTARQPVVELEQVTKTYSDPGRPPFRAVTSVSIAVRTGEFFSLLGPSGCGKSTTLRMIAGFERPTTGRVLLDGLDVTGVRPFRRDVNTVFQNYALFPHMLVEDNVAYPLKMRGIGKSETKQRVAEALEGVEMTAHATRRPHELSGGQRQRVALARALVGRPKLVLLDEPLGALDLKLRESMLVVLKQLQRDSGITFVYVTHDQSEALAMSDRIAVMSAGRIEQVARPRELYTAPETAFVAGFIGKTNLLPCRRSGGRTALVGTATIQLPRELDGDGCACSVRPEDIVIGPESSALANAFEGVVEDVLFLGHTCELIVAWEGQRLSVRVSGRAPVERGAAVSLGWDVDAATVVHGASTAETTGAVEPT